MEKAEYLRKYLGIGRAKKSKKKKEAKVVGRGLKIIDDDADFARANSDEEGGIDEDADEKPIVIESPKRQENTKLTAKNWVEHSGEVSRAGRRERHDSSDSDVSPSRKVKSSDTDLSPPRSKPARHDSDSDVSPPRKKSEPTKIFNRSKDVDLSPPRRTKESSNNDIIKKENIKREAASPDQSPPRRRRKRMGSSSPDASPPRGGRGAIQRPVKRDIRNIEVISKHNNEKEESLKMKKQKKEEVEKKKEALASKYKEWGRGLKQQERSKELLEDMEHEANKPLARYEDDEDLNEMRKNRLLKEDPMYDFMQKKLQSDPKKPKKLTYTGPQPHPNRFNIDPGYRWDGVDRSNGFEKEFFLHASNRKAVKDIAYKYMTEDM